MFKRISAVLLVICFLSVASFTHAADITRTPLTQNELQTLTKADKNSATSNTREITAGAANPLLVALISLASAVAVAVIMTDITDSDS
ncbi:MAG: hypothetical protein KAS88_05380, partial [Deltaproteobacteria bacterium]|nr:hypothetical protein [Deltaproteobacteria bacterium]